MADYYTKFSLVLSLPNQTALIYALDLAVMANDLRQADEPLGSLPQCLHDLAEDWQFETEDESTEGKFQLWLHSDDGGIDAVCAFIQHLLQKFDPLARISFEWSHDCSKPRVDAFGGGAALVTATEIKTMNTSDWLQQQSV